MVRPTVNDDARRLQTEILALKPEGARLDRLTFDRLIVQGFNKSKEAADRITKAGELLGLWTRRHDWERRQGWVEIHPVASIVVQATVVLGQPKTR